MSYFSIDALEPGQSVRLLVSLQNAYKAQWPDYSPVTVSRTGDGFEYESTAGGITHTAPDDFAANPGHRGLNSHVKKAVGAPYVIESISARELLERIYRADRRRVSGAGRWDYAPGRALRAYQRARDRVSALSDPARVDTVRDQIPRYVPESIWKRGGADGAIFEAHGESAMRWIESPESKGLRFVGLAHDVARDAGRRFGHTGWFLDDFQSETVSGVVYQLPARDGRVRYLAGYADPWNSDKAGRGPACLSLEVYESDTHGADAFGDTEAENARLDAARAANGIAERMAEAEREYREAHAAGRSARQKAAEALQAGRDMLQQCRAVRSLWRARGGCPALPGPAARDTLRAALAALRTARDEYTESRSEAHAALADAPSRTLWRGKPNPAWGAWADGYAEGESV